MPDVSVTTTTSSLPAVQRSFSPAVAISNKMARLLATYIGRGPTRARTTLDGDLVVVTFGDTMTRAELSLVAADDAELVLSMRRVLHAQMRQAAIDAVEEIVHRKVIAYMSDIDPAANMALTAFILGPAVDTHALPLDDIAAVGG